MLFKTIVILWILFLLLLVLVLLPLGFDIGFNNRGYENVLLTSIGIGFPIFILQTYLLYLVTYKKSHKKNILKYSIISFILPIIGYGIFITSNGDYTYDHSPSSNYYADSNSLYVEDIEKYKMYLDKYGFKWQKTYYLNSVEDHINIFEFAIDDLYSEGLYEATTYSALGYGIVDILKEYNNKTFEAYFYKVATNRISNVHYNITNPGGADYHGTFLMHEGGPFEQGLRYLGNNSNYEDIRKKSKKIIDSYDYYNENRNNSQVTAKIKSDLGFRGWFQYWDDIETEAENFGDNISGLEHDRKTFGIDYGIYLRIISELGK